MLCGPPMKIQIVQKMFLPMFIYAHLWFTSNITFLFRRFKKKKKNWWTHISHFLDKLKNCIQWGRFNMDPKCSIESSFQTLVHSPNLRSIRVKLMVGLDMWKTWPNCACPNHWWVNSNKISFDGDICTSNGQSGSQTGWSSSIKY